MIKKILYFSHTRLTPFFLGCFVLLALSNLLLPIVIPFNILMITSIIAAIFGGLNCIGEVYLGLIDKKHSEIIKVARSFLLLAPLVLIIIGTLLSATFAIPTACFLLAFSIVISIKIQNFHHIAIGGDSIVYKKGKLVETIRMCRNIMQSESRSLTKTLFGGFVFLALGILALLPTHSTSLVFIVTSSIALVLLLSVVLLCSLFRPDYSFFGLFTPMGYSINKPLHLTEKEMKKYLDKKYETREIRNTRLDEITIEDIKVVLGKFNYTSNAN